MHWRSYLLLCTSLFLMAPSFAQEEPNSAYLNKDYSGKQSGEWEKIQLELGTRKGKLEAQITLVKNLIESKNSLKGEALDLKLGELKSEYQKLRKYTEDYNRMNQEYLTKFPERGTKVHRTYKRVKMKSLQALENEMTVQGRVNRLHSKILTQYPKSKAAAKKPITILKSHDATASESGKTVEKDNVTEQIQLKK